MAVISMNDGCDRWTGAKSNLPCITRRLSKTTVSPSRSLYFTFDTKKLVHGSTKRYHVFRAVAEAVEQLESSGGRRRITGIDGSTSDDSRIATTFYGYTTRDNLRFANQPE